MGRAINTQLYGVSSQDPMVIATAVVVLVVTALVAAAIPARRAASLDPAQTLRGQ